MRLKSKVVTTCLVSALLFSYFACFTVQPVSAQGVTWSYNASTNTATASGAGSTNFAALVAADTAGGWGKFTADATGKQNKGIAKIDFGDGTNTITWTDTNLQILFDFATWTGGGIVIRVRNHATLTFGDVFSSAKKSTGNGCEIIFSTADWANAIQVDSGGVLNLYSCHLVGSPSYDTYIYEPSGSTVNVWNCIYDRVCPREPRGVYYGNILWAKIGINSPQSSLVFNQNTLLRATQWLGWFYNSATIQNLKSLYAGVIRTEGAITLNFVNCELDNWAFSWGAAGASLNRQYEFDLAVLNGEITEFVTNANVTLAKNNVVVGSWLTNSSGQIGTQILTYGYYQQSTGNTLQGGADPFVLTVTHPDWANYTSRFYVTEKTKMTISMQEVTGTSAVDTDEWFVVGGIVGCVFAAVVVGALLLARKND